jgi:hypothetical protein
MEQEKSIKIKKSKRPFFHYKIFSLNQEHS